MEVDRIVCLGILAVVSVIDIKYKKIPMEILIAANIGALVYRLYQGENAVLAAGGAAAGAVFLIISRVTREGVGYGDSLGILGLGIYVGLWGLLEILAGAFFLLALCAVVVLAGKKMSRKCTLPFYPFLLAAYIMWITGEIQV